ncbi:MAG TPA: tRNA pseudouridine(55) synthase TruB [Fimbriimonadales bacterium]|nr:tRNA pseudouridine(55) synthase TruB [Fimbriimonadales bacterium]
MSPIGILLINKPKNLTSHDVVDEVRRALHTRRVGHTGTLDPISEGLLVIAVGYATRFIRYLPVDPKEYIGTMTLGAITNTQDAEGEIIEKRNYDFVTLEMIREAAKSFLGDISQIPPMYSAVKFKGTPLFKLARKGEEVQRKPKKITIYHFEINDYNPPVASFRVVCSKGTYVRTLCHDLGLKLSCGAYLSALTRTRMGEFTLDKACQLDEISVEKLIPLEEALAPMPMIKLTRHQIIQARNGQPLRIPLFPNRTTIGLLDENNHLFAIARQRDSIWHPECVIPPNP